ncbi:hypothetical protein LJC17_01465 [Acholeplasma sp. OttesenSCG-928-E16]|nr:hypothetical protein [Acholeplasma sp. OttesenSCG-928-E16]
MPRNTLLDLNNHLFEQLERLNDDDLSEDEIKKESKRAKAMCTVAREIVKNARVILDGQKHVDEFGINRESNLVKITGPQSKIDVD